MEAGVRTLGSGSRRVSNLHRRRAAVWRRWGLRLQCARTRSGCPCRRRLRILPAAEFRQGCGRTAWDLAPRSRQRCGVQRHSSRASSTTKRIAGRQRICAAAQADGATARTTLSPPARWAGGDGPGSTGPGRISSPDIRSWWVWASVMRSAPLPAASAARGASASAMMPAGRSPDRARRRLRAAAASRRHHRVGRHAQRGCVRAGQGVRASSPSNRQARGRGGVGEKGRSMTP